MDVNNLVTAHYGGERDLATQILASLVDAGVDLDHLGPQDLFPVDQLHAGGAAATTRVLQAAGVGPGTRVLDVGSGIGGAARMAALAGADVMGIDLSPAFVRAAADLTARVGLAAGHADFITASGDDLPFPDDAFEAATMIHVGMNIPDKSPVFAEVHRVLRPGARFAVYEQMRVGEGSLPYPLPWAVDERSSFVETAQEYADQLCAAGFTVAPPEDLSMAGGPPPGALDQSAVFGDAFRERLGNNIEATRSGLLGAVLLVATA